MTNHKNARQYGDQIHCSHCVKQWDVNDIDPPECVKAPEPKSLHRHQQLRRYARRRSRR
jgi:hypothetical protein